MILVDSFVYTRALCIYVCVAAAVELLRMSYVERACACVCVCARDCLLAARLYESWQSVLLSRVQSLSPCCMYIWVHVVFCYCYCRFHIGLKRVCVFFMNHSARQHNWLENIIFVVTVIHERATLRNVNQLPNHYD